MSVTMSTSAMRLALERAGASAVRLSIAAAMVIAKPVKGEKIKLFSVNRPLQRSVNKK
jgi:hypothetical protein